METHQENSQVVTDTPAAAPESAPAATSAAPATPSPQTASPGEAVAAPVAPPFVPDYKLKVMDEEREIPEQFRGLIKDEKTAKEVREIFEKSFGHEAIKPKYETLKAAHQEVQTQYTQTMNQIQDLKADYARGDMDSFFQKLNIPKEKILQYALDTVNYQELPPEQKALIDAKRNAELQNMQLTREKQSVEQNLQQQMTQARSFALDSELARPDVKSMIEDFDKRAGEKGAFRKEVINRGLLTWHQSRGSVDLSPGQAVEQVMKLYGLANAPASANASATTPASVVTPSQTPTIPNVSGAKATSPVKQKPKSIADLKKMAAEM